MQPISPRELQALAKQFGIELHDEELEALREQVNSFLDGLEGIYDVSLPAGQDAPGERPWRAPSDDRLNALAVECTVPPKTDNSGLLSNVTVGVKDNITVAGVPMNCGTRVLDGFVPRTDATVVERLRESGATITAKTTPDEMAGSARGKSYGGFIRNPHDPSHTAGGSSGGSAVAVATDVVDVALGTDTGGSVRIPASFCGVVGLKPTYGLISLRGVVENTYTQDHVGPITNTVEDAARVLEAIAGPDEQDASSMYTAGRDSYSVGGYVDETQHPPKPESLLVGRLTDGFGDGVTNAVEERTNAGLDLVEDAGGEIVDVSIDDYKHSGALKNVVSFVEIAGHWRDNSVPVRRGDAIDEAYQAAFAAGSDSRSDELKRYYKGKILAGARLMEAHQGRHYNHAQAARAVLAAEVESAFEDVDVLAMPTMPDVAPSVANVDRPGFKYGRNTKLANVTRHPAITIPNGDVEGLPIGLQLLGPEFGDATLLSAAARFEELLP